MSKPVFKSVSEKQVSELLKGGAVGVLPSDTQYGIMACASSPQAVEKLYALKKRDAKPGTVIADNIEQLVGLGIKRRYLVAVQDFWPNPLSVVIPTGFDLEYLHRGKLSLAIRIPKDTKLRGLLKKIGPLMTSSANQPGERPAATIAEAQDYFADKVDFYVDGGNLGNRKPSTVIRIVDDAIEVLREGSVNIDEEGNIQK